MRFYAVAIEGAPPIFAPIPGAAVEGAQFSSVAYGVNDPGALRCHMHLELVDWTTAQPNSFVRFYGVSLPMLSQSADLNGKNISIYGGMWPGLPLATDEAKYRGLLFCGQIYQAFGNWEGLDMTLDLLIQNGYNPGGGSGGDGGGNGSGGGGGESGGAQLFAFPTATRRRLLSRQAGVGTPRTARSRARGPLDVNPLDVTDLGSAGGDVSAAFNALEGAVASFGGGSGWGKNVANLIHNAQPNQPFQDVIRQTLTQAYPWSTIDVNVSSQLKTAFQDAGFHQNLPQYASFMSKTAQSILGADKPGSGTFIFSAKCNGITVRDHTTVQDGPTIQLTMEDVIGNITWSGPSEINVKLVMRSDLALPCNVILPPNMIQNVVPGMGMQQGVNVPNTLVFGFQGMFTVTKIFHVGDSRHPDGASWCTVIWAMLLGVADAAGAAPGGAPAPAEGGQSPSPQVARRLAAREVRRYPWPRR